MVVYHFDPSRKFYLVSLTIEDKPGIVGNVADVLGIRGMNIFAGYFGKKEKESLGTFSFFVESHNQRMDTKWLKEFLETVVGVSEVEVKEPVEGFLAHSLSFPLVWSTGDRAVLMRTDYLKKAFAAIQKALGSDGQDATFRFGYEYGKAAWENLFSLLRPKSGEGLQAMLEIYAAVGWGKVELIKFEEKRRWARVRVIDGFECAGNMTGNPTGQFIRGHIAGVFSAYFKREARATETKCVSAGAQYCEIEVSPEEPTEEAPSAL